MPTPMTHAQQAQLIRAAAAALLDAHTLQPSDPLARVLGATTARQADRETTARAQAQRDAKLAAAIEAADARGIPRVERVWYVGHRVYEYRPNPQHPRVEQVGLEAARADLLASGGYVERRQRGLRPRRPSTRPADASWMPPHRSPPDEGLAPAPDAGMASEVARGPCTADTWDPFGRTFVATYCHRCHTWTQAVAQRQGAYLATPLAAGVMPLGCPCPTPTEVARMVRYLRCGAP
jgi:hypothetical protein